MKTKTTIKMADRDDKKHSVRFSNSDSKILKSIYLNRDGLKKHFEVDTMPEVFITISLEEEDD